MQLTSVLVAAATLLAPVSAHAIIPLGRRATGLDVELASVGGTRIKVSVTNTANQEVNVLKVNSFFDESPVQVVTIYNTECDKGLFLFRDCEPLPFQGIRPRYDLSDLTKEDFQTILAGATVEAVIDITETYDLEAGEYVVSADGALPFSGPDCNGITGVIPYESNKVKITVSQPSNAKVLARLDRRTIVEAETCTPEHTAVVQDALKRAGDIAAEAANAALHGDARLFESFFRTTDAVTRNAVAARFDAIAREIKAGDNGTITYSCGDGMKACSTKGTIAYAVSGRNLMVNCPIYYQISKETTSCGGKDQALTIIHELTHMSSVFKPAAADHAYGYDAIIALPKEKAIVNADTFLYYASSINLNCDVGAGKTNIPDWLMELIIKEQKSRQ